MINHRVITLCAGAVIALCGTASAVDGPVGSIQLNDNALSVTPAVSYAELQITVSGESVYWQKSYGPGEAVYVSTAEIGSMPDGDYSYQVIAAPAVDEAAWEAAEDDAALERKLEFEENFRTHIQAGNFEVIGGEVLQISDDYEKQAQQTTTGVASDEN